MPRKCTIGGCGKSLFARGWCSMHYMRWRTHGDPLAVRRLTGADHPRWKGGDRVDSYGYARVYLGGGMYRAKHRVVMEATLGRALLPGESVHHINGDKLDNRPENLELWVSHQPSGQRVEDLLAWAKEIIQRYAGTGPNQD